MSFEWKNWCRFCGNAGITTKIEYSFDADFYFQISEVTSKVCQTCNLFLNEFKNFKETTRKTNQLFKDLLSEENTLNQERINELRSNYNLDVLEIEVENDIKEFKLLDDLNLDIKDEPENVLEDHLAIEFENNDENSEHQVFEDDVEERTQKTSGKERTKLVTKASNLPCICHICNVEYSRMVDLQAHCKKSHNTRPQVPCVCGFILNNRWTYTKHRKRCCGDHEILYRCDLCPKKFFLKHKIDKHMVLEHLSVVKKYPCETCAKTFRAPNLLRAHQISHLPEEEKKKFPCTSCDKRFPTKVKLTEHLRRHTESENSQNCSVCSVCGKSLKSLESLNSHLKIHNTSLDYACNICKKKFKTSSYLATHKQSHADYNIKCPVCDRLFNRQEIFKKHLELHTQVFKCTEPNCDMEFKKKSVMVNHVRTVHEKLRQFVCEWCNWGYTTIKIKRRHQIKKHPEEYYAMKNNRRN